MPALTLRPSAPKPFIPWIVVLPFVASGITHLVRPAVFEPIIPTRLRPRGRALVYVSGVAELGCAALLLHPSTRRLGGLASAAVLFAVWPANAQMSVDLARRFGRRRDARSLLGLLASIARLPLQLPLIRAALRAH